MHFQYLLKQWHGVKSTKGQSRCDIRHYVNYSMNICSVLVISTFSFVSRLRPLLSRVASIRLGVMIAGGNALDEIGRSIGPALCYTYKRVAKR